MTKPSVSKITRVRAGSLSKLSAPVAKPAKRENTFSKSKDIREDRGLRQAKTTRKPQTLSRGGK